MKKEFDRLVQFIDNSGYKIKLEWVRGRDWGEIDEDKQIIRINLAISIVDTFIHEYLHAIHPKWSEKKVKEATRKKMKRLTRKEVELIASRIEFYNF